MSGRIAYVGSDRRLTWVFLRDCGQSLHRHVCVLSHRVLDLSDMCSIPFVDLAMYSISHVLVSFLESH